MSAKKHFFSSVGSFKSSSRWGSCKLPDSEWIDGARCLQHVHGGILAEILNDLLREVVCTLAGKTDGDTTDETAVSHQLICAAYLYTH